MQRSYVPRLKIKNRSECLNIHSCAARRLQGRQKFLLERRKNSIGYRNRDFASRL
jgi:hypothetical protein